MNSVFVLAGLGIFSLLAEIFNIKKLLFPVVILGLIAAAVLLVLDWNLGAAFYSNMLTFDNYAVAFSVTLSLTAMLWFLMSKDYFENNTHITDHFALIMFSLVGAVFMVSYSNLAMLFLGIEVLSICLYILAGSNFKNIFSNEASFKYFLMGSFATTSGMSRELFRAANAFLGHLRGGLGIATIAACGGFAAISRISFFTIASAKLS